MRKSVHILPLLLLVAGLAHGQASLGDSPLRVSVSTGTQVASGFGQVQALQWVAPSLKYEVTPRLTVAGGFAAVGSLVPQLGTKNSGDGRDLLPRRGGTQATAFWGAASYRLGESLTLWGAVAHAGGTLQPMWADRALPLDVTAFSGGLRWQMTDSQLLELHFRVVRGQGGAAACGPCGYPFHTMAPSLGPHHDPWMW
ncbi:MAG: hypothetical protein IJ760_08755 [Bacteroidales bacterium]|nr:hypothetical protein [Bacteroidales bacterium]